MRLINLAWRKRQEEKAQAIRDAEATVKEQASLPKAPVIKATQPDDEVDIASMLDEI